MSRWNSFYKNVQQDFKLFIFILLVLCVFRAAFIIILREYISKAASAQDILLSLVYGLRISIKSAGFGTLFSFFFCTLWNVLRPKAEAGKRRFWLGSVYIGLLTVLFLARFPYYEEFHTGFNQMIFNAFREGSALLFTLVEQYHLLLWLPVAVVITLLLSLMLRRLLATKLLATPQFSRWYQTLAFRSVFLLIIALFMVSVRFGGSLTYIRSFHWENCSVLKDDFLNEAVLDDIQALYRAYSIHNRISNGMVSGVNEDTIQRYITAEFELDGKSGDIDELFKAKAPGAKIPKPKHIFIILGESYAQWPTLDKYSALNIANGLKGIMARDNASHISAFLPNGAFTPMAVTGLVSGLSDVNLYPAYHPESYKGPYATALAPQMKQLGYKTFFWYGGPSTWQNIKDFVIAQGFDEFFGAGHIDNEAGNVWGVDDAYLFKSIASFQYDAPSVHVVLTVSNHAPYTVNLQREGFDQQAVVEALPAEATKDEDLIKRLGHYWYSDKVITDFVDTIYNRYPDSIFVITGDHANRTNIESNPSLFERHTVPLVIYGQGVYKGLLDPNTAGGHVDIGPTLIELIAPEGFIYHALGGSLTKGGKAGFSHDVWVTSNALGKIDGRDIENILGSSGEATDAERERAQEIVNRMRVLSWWRIAKGKNI